MKHAGKARKAAFKLILYSLIALCVVWALIAAGAVVAALGMVVAPFLIFVWVVFSIFTLYFFRDPEARPPGGANLILAPAHGKVDFIQTTTEPQFMAGECQRISIFLSVIDVHVQNAPISGKITLFRYSTGQFLNALRSECSDVNENVLLGIEGTEPAGVRIALRLVAGVIARRIVPFVKEGDVIVKGERISLIQFGSRADLYLPVNAKLRVNLGDRVVGGKTVVAELE